MVLALGSRGRPYMFWGHEFVYTGIALLSALDDGVVEMLDRQVDCVCCVMILGGEECLPQLIFALCTTCRVAPLNLTLEAAFNIPSERYPSLWGQLHTFKSGFNSLFL